MDESGIATRGKLFSFYTMDEDLLDYLLVGNLSREAQVFPQDAAEIENVGKNEKFSFGVCLLVSNHSQFPAS